MGIEEERLEEARKREKNWQRWGPYLSERQWATVREDYSSWGTSWDYFPHDHARSRAYRWGEDGIFGLTDRECRLCFSLAFWNGRDPILKERFFGLTSIQGNHGEDVKECYYYLDSTPTHSYMQALYKYPHAAYPYEALIIENQKRGLHNPEFELMDTKIFEDNHYFDIFIEYAKRSPNNILIKISATNRSQNEAPLHLIPTLLYRNTWSWGPTNEQDSHKYTMYMEKEGIVSAPHASLGQFYLAYSNASDNTAATPLFTENETNNVRLFGIENLSPYVKDAFHEYLIHGNKEAVNPAMVGSKFGCLYSLQFGGLETKTLYLSLYSEKEHVENPFGEEFQKTFQVRKAEADAFYQEKIADNLPQEEKQITRQAYAGLLWTKQFYHFIITEWLDGDPYQPLPPPERKLGRNVDWTHLFCRDIISMPDKWEYPWFAAWDLSFHMIPFARIDPTFAKNQIILFLREWYMHPNGETPAYEFEFSDVNPPVHAWSAWRVYKISNAKGDRDFAFLESAYQKLLLNFTWWVNRKDKEGNNLFAGGFLGMDNIGVFDRSKPLPKGGYLQQADGTAWMAFYCLIMLNIALELATNNPIYEDMASKFFEHFVFITDAINQFGGSGLWDEEDGFFYDRLKADGEEIPLKTRSIAGLVALIAVGILEDEQLKKVPGFRKRMEWFINHRHDLEGTITYCQLCSVRGHRILAIPSKERLTRMLRYVLDESEFLSPFGIRSLSKFHESHPFIFHAENAETRVEYVPGVSNNFLFGGNSNWRGPIWLPINFLIIDALERYDFFYGEDLKVECPVGSGKMLTLKEVAQELTHRLCTLFLATEKGKRPCHGDSEVYASDPHWKDLLLFHEYFHAETGEGLGASHQTGWTAIIAKLLEKRRHPS